MMASPTSFDFLHGLSGQVVDEIVALDWQATPLGAPESWPIALRSQLATMLACPVPMYMVWGPELISFYNDAYRPILGYRADAAMGTPFRILWGSIWDEIAPLVDKALSGQVAKVTDMRLDLARSGQPEESYWTFSYSPVFDDAGGIAGMICVTGETTDRVLAERRQRASDERLDLALSSGAHVGLWDWDVLNDSVRSDARFAAMWSTASCSMGIARWCSGNRPSRVRRAWPGTTESWFHPMKSPRFGRPAICRGA